MGLVKADGTPIDSNLEVSLHPDGAATLNGVYYSMASDISSLIRITFGPILVQMAAQSAGVELPKVVQRSWRVRRVDPETRVVTFELTPMQSAES